MSTPVLTFFNNKGGVGKTSLVYHLSWMFADLGLRVLAVDLDPQANLSSAFLTEDDFESLFSRTTNEPPATIYAALRPLIEGSGDILVPELCHVGAGRVPLQLETPIAESKPPALHPGGEPLCLIPGDLLLSTFEDQLSEAWPKCSDRDIRAFRVTSAFWRVMQMAADKMKADIILVDVGPNLGAINRAALIASDHVVIPLAPDLFSLQGLKNLGPRLHSWRHDWREKLQKFTGGNFSLPPAHTQPIGYIVQQHAVRLDRPVKAYARWMDRIPGQYRESILDKPSEPGVRVDNDPYCLALLKNYRSLMPLAQEARKPMFHLKNADGAIGGHAMAALEAYQDYKLLAEQIAFRANMQLKTTEDRFR
jgi:cellulose biosynthesis protein BcsQ